MKKYSVKKTVVLTNPLNSETWLCEDFGKIKEIDGVPYVTVFKPENTSRTFLMRKDALRLGSKSYL
jgi:hypothetical protein